MDLIDRARALDRKTVGIPAGTIVTRHTHPSACRAGEPLRRAQEVKVAWTTASMQDHMIEITWAGTGGYWKSVKLPAENIVVIDDPA